MRRTTALVLLVLFVFQAQLHAGIGSKNAQYVGGTITTVPEKTEGKPSTATADAFVFESKKGKIVIPYAQVNSLEYGQKAGRRVGLAVAVSPLFLFSKKRKHYLTIGFTDDEQKQQAAVFELGKGVIRPTIAHLEAKTGKKVEYQDEESRKAGQGK